MKELTGNADLLRDISTLGLKSRTFNALVANGYSHVADIVALSDWRILKREVGLGETALLDIKTKLARIGLTTEMVKSATWGYNAPDKEAQLREVFRIPADVSAPTDKLFAEPSLSEQLPLIPRPSRKKGQINLDL